MSAATTAGRRSDALPQRFVTVGGVVAGLSCLYLFVTDTAFLPIRAPAGAVEFALLGIPALGLLYTGYWLRTGEFSDPEVWHVGFSSVSGVFIATIITGVMLLAYPPAVFTPTAAFFLFVSTGSEGALLGVVVGVLDTSVFGSTPVFGEGDGETRTDGARPAETERREREDSTVERLVTLNSVLRHNIRNRLTILNGYVEMVAEEERPNEAYLEKIHAQQDAILDLLEDAKVASEAARDTEWRSVALDDVVADQVRLVASSHDDVAVSVSVPEGTSVRADGMLSSVLENLLENAVEHHDRDEKSIEIRADVEGDTVRLTVADDGPGIPDEAKPDVCEPNVGDGTGMGLYLVETIVTGYGGDVEIADNDPRGTAVTLTFDRANGDASGETRRENEALAD